jgi:hypothetical protein
MAEAGTDGWFAGPAGPAGPGPVEEAAQVVNRLAAPSHGSTRAGLPRREPRAHLVPGAFGAGPSGGEAADREPKPAGRDSPPAQSRVPEQVRSRLLDYQQGVLRGRRQDLE